MEWLGARWLRIQYSRMRLIADAGEALIMANSCYILLAEDNSGDVFLVKQSLKHHGIACSLMVFNDGEEAGRHIREAGSELSEGIPAVILLDLNLPKTDGHELLRMVRSQPKLMNTPVVIITSSNSPEDRRRSVELGANQYFRKPLDLDQFLELGAVIKQVLKPDPDPQ